MPRKKITVVFFVTEAGAEPVREWVRSLSWTDQKLIGDEIRTVEYGWPIGMPVCRALGDRLYEVRISLKDRIARVLFTIDADRMVLLNGFIKKSQATPDSELKLARTRLQAWYRRKI
jgi:phage-related protein